MPPNPPEPGGAVSPNGIPRGETVAQFMARLQVELRQIANRELRGERLDHTLQPTALVNEAFLRLIGANNLDEATKNGFLAAAATAMRRILVDYARARNAEKRGDKWARITITGNDPASEDPEVELIALHEAVESLAKQNARMAAVVELRYFAGLTVKETAEALGVSNRTVADDWSFARAWLKRAMAG